MIFSVFCIPGNPQSNILNTINRYGSIPDYEYKTPSLLLALWKRNSFFFLCCFNNLGIEEKYVKINKNIPPMNTLKNVEYLETALINIYEDYNQSYTKEQIVVVQNDLYLLVYLGRKISKTIKLRNIFTDNYLLLENLNQIQIYNKKIEDSFKNHSMFEIWQKSKTLDTINNILGVPHLIIGGCDGFESLIYFGYHRCKKGVFFGIYHVVIDKYNRVRSIYKNFEMCPSCSNHKKNIVKSEDADYFISTNDY